MSKKIIELENKKVVKIIESTPNNYRLGAKIRAYYLKVKTGISNEDNLRV